MLPVSKLKMPGGSDAKNAAATTHWKHHYNYCVWRQRQTWSYGRTKLCLAQPIPRKYRLHGCGKWRSYGVPEPTKPVYETMLPALKRVKQPLQTLPLFVGMKKPLPNGPHWIYKEAGDTTATKTSNVYRSHTKAYLVSSHPWKCLDPSEGLLQQL